MKRSPCTGLRRWKLASTSTILGLAFQLHAADVSTFGVIKGQTFAQTSTGPALASSDSNFVFQVFVDSEGEADEPLVTNATLRLPNGVSMPLTDENHGYSFEAKFASLAALDAAFPNGTYTLTIGTVNDGLRTNSVALIGNVYPGTPHISNFAAAQMVDPASQFTLTWDPLSGGTAADFVQVSIRDCRDDEFLGSSGPGEPNALNGLATSYVIPAGTLRSGQTYTVELFVARLTTFDTTNYPGAQGIAAYLKRLQMPLVTTGPQLGCPRGHFQLVFNFQHGTFGSGTVGTIPFPQSVSYYFALYNVGDDSAYPDTVTFSGPAGSGLSNTTNQNIGSSFGDNAFYSTPQINTPPFPPGGIYTVNYKGEDQQFSLPDPNSANQQVLIVPGVILSSSNTITEIQWTYRDTSGAIIPPQPFMNNIQIRVDGMGGRLYNAPENHDEVILPSTTSHMVTRPVFWTNVSMVSLVFEDDKGTTYNSYWTRGLQPLEITTSNLPPATQGLPYSFLLSAMGGDQPVTWTVGSGFLPSGLFLSSVTGEIKGTPGESGLFSMTPRAVDNRGQVANRALSLFVNPGTFPRPVFTNQSTLGNQFRVQLITVPDQTYTVEISTNLTLWTPLFTTTVSTNLLDLTDPEGVSGTERRFYRARIGR